MSDAPGRSGAADDFVTGSVVGIAALALPHRLESRRFKEVVHPARTTWMHHLELTSVDDLDAEVVGRPREAADAAG